MTDPTWIPAARQYALASIADCADALGLALRGESASRDGSADPFRVGLDTGNGQLLVMPSTSTGRIGVKLVTVAGPGTAVDGPRIQGVHVQFDPVTLAPKAILDAIALTNIRTAAVTVLALRALADPGSRELLVFGSGPQALHHIRGICAGWPIERVRVIGRRTQGARLLAAHLAESLVGVDVAALAPDEVAGALATSDIVVCATNAATPVFDGRPDDGAAIVAVGSHSPTERELPSALMRRAYIAVEDRAAALREAGDIVLAIADGAMDPAGIDADLRELVRGAVVDVGRPRVFKSVGMAWQDAVVADAILARVT